MGGGLSSALTPAGKLRLPYSWLVGAFLLLSSSLAGFRGATFSPLRWDFRAHPRLLAGTFPPAVRLSSTVAPTVELRSTYVGLLGTFLY